MPATSAGMTISSNRAKPESSSGKRPETAMAQSTTSLPLLPGFDRARWMAVVDWLAVALAISLPWSTSVTEIFVWLWIAAVLPTLDANVVRRELANPAAYLPVLLFGLAVIGMLWADVSWHDRLGGLSKFLRLLWIPVLLIHFRRSERGLWVIYGFFAASVLLLVVSWGLVLTPGLTWRGRDFGVPTNNYIFQSMNFLICTFALLGVACETARQWRRSAGALVLVLLFVANLVFVVTSRTALLVVPVLFVWLGWKEFRWRGLFGTLLLLLVLGSAAWSASPYLHDRLTRSVTEYEAYRDKNEPNSTGLHLEFLRKSLSFVETAPIIGHGTGSISEQFRLSETGHESASSFHSENPHNQIFAVSIQLGLVGTAVVIAMWIAHLLLFTGGSGLVAWIGTIIVVQNMVSSLFNSHLFDFTSGWLYVFGVGVVGGMVLRQKDIGKDIPLIPPLAATRV
jgi:O-antigen ligase